MLPVFEELTTQLLQAARNDDLESFKTLAEAAPAEYDFAYNNSTLIREVATLKATEIVKYLAEEPKFKLDLNANECGIIACAQPDAELLIYLLKDHPAWVQSAKATDPTFDMTAIDLLPEYGSKLLSLLAFSAENNFLTIERLLQETELQMDLMAFNCDIVPSAINSGHSATAKIFVTRVLQDLVAAEYPNEMIDRGQFLEPTSLANETQKILSTFATLSFRDRNSEDLAWVRDISNLEVSLTPEMLQFLAETETFSMLKPANGKERVRDYSSVLNTEDEKDALRAESTKIAKSILSIAAQFTAAANNFSTTKTQSKNSNIR